MKKDNLFAELTSCLTNNDEELSDSIFAEIDWILKKFTFLSNMLFWILFRTKWFLISCDSLEEIFSDHMYFYDLAYIFQKSNFEQLCARYGNTKEVVKMIETIVLWVIGPENSKNERNKITLRDLVVGAASNEKKNIPDAVYTLIRMDPAAVLFSSKTSISHGGRKRKHENANSSIDL